MKTIAEITQELARAEEELETIRQPGGYTGLGDVNLTKVFLKAEIITLKWVLGQLSQQPEHFTDVAQLKAWSDKKELVDDGNAGPLPD